MAELYSNAYAYHIFFIHSFFRSIIISQYSQNHLFYQIQKFLTIARNRQSPHFSSKYLLVSLVYISRVLSVISGLFKLIFRNHFLGFSDINQCGKVVFLSSPTTKYLYVPKYLAAQSSEFKFVYFTLCMCACMYIYALCAYRSLQKEVGKGLGSPRSMHGCWELNLSPLQVQ